MHARPGNKSAKTPLATFDAGRLLEAIGRELANGHDIIVSPEASVAFDKNGKSV